MSSLLLGLEGPMKTFAVVLATRGLASAADRRRGIAAGLELCAAHAGPAGVVVH
jgi:hypothetical protein